MHSSPTNRDLPGEIQKVPSGRTLEDIRLFGAEDGKAGPYGATTHIFYTHPYNLGHLRVLAAALSEWSETIPALERLDGSCLICLRPAGP